ncbi:nitroreductase family protein [Armatimonas sp.]|uniref:nitroreductase family protein n=1 Tax=Armatimonas sp. TaxID=1872638 RepID=UPI0034D95A48
MDAELLLARERRSIREFSERPVPRELIAAALSIACTAPSGANRQPWRFVVIGDPTLKARLREAAEAEEREFYAHRATPEWLADLAPLGTDAQKSFLTTAPYVIVVFRESYGIAQDGGVLKNYYSPESVGIAVGFLIAALNRFGLATLTHTPSPMGFLSELCGRPKNEKAFVVLPVGYPADDCTVPDIGRLPESETIFWAI